MSNRIELTFSATNPTETEGKKLSKVFQEFYVIINSDLFRQKILDIKYKHGECSMWNKATNEEIYKHIMRGNVESEHQIDLLLEFYYSWRNVVGYTYPNSEKIYLNRKYFGSTDDRAKYHHRKMAGSNLIHEYSHKIGFDHDFRNTARRKYSLSYLLNDIYEECWDELIAPTLERVEVERYYRKWFRTYKETVVYLKDKQENKDA